MAAQRHGPAVMVGKAARQTPGSRLSYTVPKARVFLAHLPL